MGSSAGKLNAGKQVIVTEVVWYCKVFVIANVSCSWIPRAKASVLSLACISFYLHPLNILQINAWGRKDFGAISDRNCHPEWCVWCPCSAAQHIPVWSIHIFPLPTLQSQRWPLYGPGFVFSFPAPSYALHHCSWIGKPSLIALILTHCWDKVLLSSILPSQAQSKHLEKQRDRTKD